LDFAIAEFTFGQRAALVHANPIERVQESAMAKYSDNISIRNHFDSLALGQRVA
jgi:hypothetical protein